MKKNLTLLLSVIIFILSVAFGLQLIIKNPLSNDSYLHMGVGRFIIDNKKIPSHSDVSYKQTQPSLEFIDHSWASDIVIYLVGRTGTLASIFLVSLMLLLSCFILFKILNELETTTFMRFFTMSIALLLAPVFFKLHPFIFAIPILLLMLYVYFSWKKSYGNSLFYLPFLFILFANFAGGFIFIPVFLYILINLIEVVNILFTKISWNKLLQLIALTFVSFLATLLNPNFERIWVYFLTYLVVTSYPGKFFSQLPGALKLINQNYLKQSIPSTLYVFFVVYLFFIFSLLIILLVRERKKFLKLFFDQIPFLLFFLFAIKSVRLVPMVVFVTAPLFAILVTFLSKKIKYFDLAFITILFLTLLFLFISPPNYPQFDPPVKQLEVIKKYNLPDNILSSFDITGYLYYKNYPDRTWLDAQDDLFDENDTINLYTYVLPLDKNSLNNLIQKNNIKTILAAKDTGGLVSPLNDLKDQWSLLYFDYSGFLYVKKDSVPASFLDKYALDYIDISQNLGFDSKKANETAKQLESFIVRYPESVLAKGELASIYRIQNRYDLAEQTLDKIPKNRWNFIVYTEMGRIKAAQGLCFSAEEYFLDALKQRYEQNYSRAVLDLAVLYASCLNDKEKAKHYFQRYSSFPITSSEHEFVRELMDKFDIKLDQ